MTLSIGGKDLYQKVYGDKDAEAAAGPDMAKILRPPSRRATWPRAPMFRTGTKATNMVITGKAGGQIMGDWAQGEFQLANQKAGTDYTCLPGLGLNDYLTTGGDAFYFRAAEG